MKTTQAPPPKRLKPPTRTVSLFSCAFFRHCTDTPLSPTLPPSSSTPDCRPPPPPLPPPSSHRTLVHTAPKPSDSESSSSSTSQSFTQWRFPPTFHHPHSDSLPSTTPQPPPQPPNQTLFPPPPPPPPLPVADLREIFHVAELNFTSGSDSDRVSALHMMERSLVPNPPSDAVSGGGADAVVVPTIVMSGVIDCMKDTTLAKTATKILLALCLAEGNRKVAIECQGGARVVDVLADLDGPAAERALAALDLMCTAPEGAAEVRAHALAVPMLVSVMGQMEGRGREYAISVLSAVYGGSCGGGDRLAPPEEVARAVVLAMQQGDCSARAKRKGAHLLKTLEDNGRLDLTQDP